ncbi:pirin family protein [Vibrio salinus]|uniref:pirin family protein n=1 Tax=Vibrio salinus TaxID=2899784 RepID=UPI001E650C42|nr:pirin family protein [Vibrio salinus]MCE0494937.1 pirin family protein [Vibrio salinus]
MSFQTTVKKIIPTQPTSDGDGVKIRRIAVFNDNAFSPFLMLDELKSDDNSDYIGGFPPHPHRGIETLTYMISGHFQHRDHLGNQGELRDGGAQWMSAGKGIIHSEMPIMKAGQLLGFQIWINQPAASKLSPAQYQDFQSETIPVLSTETGVRLKVISGSVGIENEWIEGPLQQTSINYDVADLMLADYQSVTINLHADHQHFLYVYQGTVQTDEQHIGAGSAVLLSEGTELKIQAEKTSGVLILSGKPIHEPVVHYGPFVMNSLQEIEQAIDDFNSGKFETYE